MVGEDVVPVLPSLVPYEVRSKMAKHRRGGGPSGPGADEDEVGGAGAGEGRRR